MGNGYENACAFFGLKNGGTIERCFIPILKGPHLSTNEALLFFHLRKRNPPISPHPHSDLSPQLDLEPIGLLQLEGPGHAVELPNTRVFLFL